MLFVTASTYASCGAEINRTDFRVGFWSSKGNTRKMQNSHLRNATERERKLEKINGILVEGAESIAVSYDMVGVYHPDSRCKWAGLPKDLRRLNFFLVGRVCPSHCGIPWPSRIFVLSTLTNQVRRGTGFGSPRFLTRR